MEAAQKGHTQITQLLIEYGANLPDDKSDIIKSLAQLTGWNRLHTAVLNNSTDSIIQHKDTRGISTPAGKNNLTPLKLAIFRVHVDSVQALIAKGAEIDIDSCLRTATFVGRANMVQYFLEKGAKPFAKSQSNNT